MKNILITKVFLLINGLLLSFLVVLAALSYQSYMANTLLIKMLHYKEDVYDLAIDYRESIEEQNNSVRAFIATGNEMYERRAIEIKMIRDGELAGESGYAISLTNRKNKFKFTSVEEQKIIESDEAYYKCLDIQMQAINATKGYFNDGFGNYTLKQTADPQFANQLIYSDEYEELCSDALEPIDEFMKLIEERIEEELTEQQEKNELLNKFKEMITIIVIALIIISFIIVRNKVILPIKQLRNYSEQIVNGDFSTEITKRFNDEVGALIDAFRRLTVGLKEKSDFVSHIGNGNYDFKFTPSSDKDIMGKNLLVMRRNLILTREVEEKRKDEDAQRRWTTEGLAKFADILRKDTDNIKKLSQNIIINLVKYLKANQGGLFIVTTQKLKSDKIVEQVACYAYDRLRKEKRILDADEGLIGRVLFEKKTIYLTEIPDNYLTITSGLGYASPKTLILVPLKLNNEVLGVVELASFKEFTQIEIEFVERVGESIASTITTTKINERTAKLLMESREQAEVLAAQEEEMRQNIEELQATQEAFDIKEQQNTSEIERLNKENADIQNKFYVSKQKINSLLNAIGSNLLVAELNNNWKIVLLNNAYIELFGADAVSNFQGKSFAHLLHRENQISDDEFNSYLNELSKGTEIRKQIRLQIGEKEILTTSVFCPVFDSNSRLHSITLVSFYTE